VTTIPHTIRRSNRAKRVSVRVDPRDGGIEVVLPQRATAADAANALVELEPWIARQQAKLAGARAVVADRGDTLPYLGTDLVVERQPDRTRVHRRGDVLLVPEDDPSAIERWYRRQAQRELGPRVDAAARELERTAPGRIGITYARTTIRDQSTRWGSCSQTGTISLNWRLMLAPDEVAEYVVVHEVCHLAEMNHSERYWALVAALYPDYERPRRWLRQHAATLTVA